MKSLIKLSLLLFKMWRHFWYWEICTVACCLLIQKIMLVQNFPSIFYIQFSIYFFQEVLRMNGSFFPFLVLYIFLAKIFVKIFSISWAPHQKFPGITAEKNPKHSRKVSAVFRTCFECTLNEQVIYMTISRRTVKKHSNSLGRFFLPIFSREYFFAHPRLQSKKIQNTTVNKVIYIRQIQRLINS